MNAPSMEQSRTNEVPGSAQDQTESYCPECLQPLDLARYQAVPVKRRTLGPIVFLVFGLCLTVAFGLRAMQAATQLVSLDQQIAALQARASQGTLPKPGNPTMIVEDTLGELQINQLDLQLTFQRDVTGLGLGLLTTIVGGVSLLHERPGVVDRRRKRTRPHGISPSDRPQFDSLWNLGGLVATSLVRMVLLLFVIITGLQVIRGTPPSLQLVDQALTRIITIVLTVASSLS